jgi:RHS repeat-associated protein
MKISMHSHNRDLYDSRITFSACVGCIAIVFLVLSLTPVRCQGIQRSGVACVGSTIMFTYPRTCSSITWEVLGTNFTIVGRTSHSVSVKWNQVQSGVSVRATFSGCGSSPYSGSLTYSSFAIHAAAIPHITINADENDVCLGTSVSFSAVVSDGGVSPTYKWKVDGKDAPGSTNEDHYTSSTLTNGQVVTCDLVTYTACTSSPYINSNAISMVFNSPKQLAVRLTGSTTVCAQTGLYLNTSVSNAVGTLRYRWQQNGSVVTSNTPGPTPDRLVLNPVNGIDAYRTGDVFTCTVSTDAACYLPTTTEQLTVTITPRQNFVVSATPSKTTLCQGKSVTFTAASSATLSDIHWSENGNTVPNEAQTTYTTKATSATQLKSVTVTASTAGCYTNTGNTSTNNASIPYVVSPIPAQPKVAELYVILKNTEAHLTAEGAYADEGYHWYDAPAGGSPISAITPALTDNTTFYVAKYSLTSHCESNQRVPFVVTTDAAPSADAGEDRSLVLTNDPSLNSATIVGMGSDPDGSIASYTWSQISGPSTAQLNQTLATANLQFSERGSYVFRLKVTDNYGFDASDDMEFTVAYPDNNYNYVTEETVFSAGARTASDVDALTVPLGEKSKMTQVMDGLGRPMQKINMQGSPSNNDIVQPIAFDKNGRESLKYLPYVSWDGNGLYKDDPLSGIKGYLRSPHNLFYSNGASDQVADDNRPFSETVFEASPLNRPSKEYGPGLDWKNGSTHDNFRASSFLTNVDGTAIGSEQIIFWIVNASGKPMRSTFINYPTGHLQILSTTDEQGHEVREYMDKEGRTILKKVQAVDTPNVNNTEHWAQTYYIYDDLGMLRFVLQPNLSQTLAARGDNPTEDELDNLAFQYTYDARQRLIQKQIPGAGPVSMVYDGRDRIVLTQDANQRKQRQWIFNKYDAFNRPVLTGKYSSNKDPVQMQLQVDAYYENLTASQSWFETYGSSNTVGLAGYDNKSFPQIADAADCYTVFYYDRYDVYIAPPEYAYAPELPTLASQEVSNNNRVKGQLTATLVNDLATNTWLRTVNYFDNKYRLIQSISDYPKGTLRLTNVLDFAGRVLVTRRRYVVNSVTNYITEKFAYDKAGNLVSKKHAINDSPDVVLFQNTYNGLNQLVDKQLHSTDFINFMQSVDYSYNIRGWLLKINQADATTIAPLDVVNDYFGMELGYNKPCIDLEATTPEYNGNISTMIWSNGGHKQHAYTFDYDPLDRLRNANHYDNDSLTWARHYRAYSEKNIVYDMNGNIQKLRRFGYYGSFMDDLTYSYDGLNKLLAVDDAAAAADGFVNGNTGPDDYAYDNDKATADGNGNLTADANKGITDITYNYLNLVQQVNKGAGEYLVYNYDATGRKLAQQVFGSSPKITDYIGELIYEDDVLKMIQTSEGRVLPDGPGWEYQYFMKDHLGNVRVTFTTKPAATTTYGANFETSTNKNFQNYDRTALDLVDHTDAGTAKKWVHWLAGGPRRRVGISKSLDVMPGDKVSVSTFAKYMNLGTKPNPSPLITSLATAFGVSATSVGDQLKLFKTLNTYAASVAGGAHPGDDDALPKAFVTILLLDKAYNLVDASYAQITANGEQSSATVKQPPHSTLQTEITATEPGFALAFLSNENEVYVDVYFDDVTVTYSPSPIVNISDYMPFGLTFNSYSREKGVKQDYQFNGKELQDELNLGWLDYGARMYMADVGRWVTVDPLADKFYPSSPYSYVLNNPANLIDPDGRSGEAVVDEKNKTVTVNMVYVFYGSGATQEDVDAAVATLNKMWNANADEDGWSDGGDGWKVHVNATGVITDEEGAQQMSEENEGNALFNYVRVEEENKAEGSMDINGVTDHKVSKQDGNSGFWITRDMKDTTPAHESGHGLNVSDPWHSNAEGIMVPGTDDRKVTPSNVNELRRNALQGQDKSSLVDKYLFDVKRVNVGSTTTTIYDKNGIGKN